VIHFDTSFVIDLLREGSREEDRPATALLDSLPPDEFAISVFVVCELLAGAALARRGEEERLKVWRFCSTFRIANPSGDFAETYGTLVAAAKRSGRNLGVMDLLIATAAVREKAHLVTRDRKDFLDIAGLNLITY
jgi:predicted nucleic acid-binding protein